MLSYFEDEIAIAKVEVGILEQMVRSIRSQHKMFNIADILYKSEEFCNDKYKTWMRLNVHENMDGGSDNLDEEIRLIVEELIFEYDSVSSEVGLVEKLVSILSSLLSCLSKRDQNGELLKKCCGFLDGILRNLCEEQQPPSNSGSSTSSRIDKSEEILESTCSILEIRLGLRSVLKKDSKEMESKFVTYALFILRKAADMGNRKMVAKICSALFEELALHGGDDEKTSMASKMLDILAEDSPEDSDNSSVESRCVGVYCLVKASGTLISNWTIPTCATAPGNNPTASNVDRDAAPNLQCGPLLIRLVQRYITSDKPFVRKCGRSLLALLLENSSQKVADDTMFRDFLTLMETFELKQLHMLKPAFGLLDRLILHCQNADQSQTNCFDVGWLRLAFYTAMHHVNAFVVKWAVGKYFEMNVGLTPAIVGDKHCQFLFDVVLRVLNRSDAYYRFSEESGLPQFLENMEWFLRETRNIWEPVTFWRTWLRTLAGYRMGSVPLFYLSHILSKLSDDHEQPAIFDISDIGTFRSIFWEFRQIPQPFVRTAIQEANLKILLNLCDWNETLVVQFSFTVFSLVPRSVIRPRKAARFSSPENNHIWLRMEPLDTKLLDIASCSVKCCNAKQTETIGWNYDALRGLVVVLDSQISSRSLDPARSPLSNKVNKVIRESGTDGLRQIKFNEIRDRIPVLAAWYETSPKLLFIDTLADYVRWIAAILDIIVHAICTGDIFLCQVCNKKHPITVEKFAVFIHFVDVALNFLGLNKNAFGVISEQLPRHMTDLKAAYSWCETNNMRRFAVLQAFGLVLEDGLVCFGSIAPDKEMAKFVGQLVLSEDDLVVDKVNEFDSGERNRILSEHHAAKWRCLLAVCQATPADKTDTGWDELDWVRLGEIGLEHLETISGARQVHYVIQCMEYILPNILHREHTLVAWLIKKMRLGCYEQRKSDQFIPTVWYCCTAMFTSPLVFSRCPEVLDELTEVVHTFMAETENPSLACCVSAAIGNMIMNMKKTSGFDHGQLGMDEEFVLKTLVELCCFGIVFRKDQKVLHDASEFIRDTVDQYGRGHLSRTSVVEVESDPVACQKTRFSAFCAVLRLLERVGEAKAVVVNFLVDLACAKLSELISGATKNGYFANSQCHRVRTRAVQLLLLLEPFISDVALAERLQQFTLQYLTENNQQPSVRLLLEWLMTRLNLRFIIEGLLEKWWQAESYMVSKRVGTLCTWMEVLMHTGLCMPLDQRRAHTLNCVKRWLPWCTAQNFTLRCCAQTCLRRLWLEEQKRAPSVLDDEWKMLDELLTPTISFNKEQRNNAKAVEKASKDFYFSLFNADTDYSLETIFYTFPWLCFLPIEELIPVNFWCYERFNSIPIRNESRDLESGSVFVWRDRAQAALGEEVNTGTLQTKTNLFSGEGDIVPLDLEMEKDKSVAQEDGLVVVATLVDRPTNLGGLCRTCEIFGVSEYAVSTNRVVDDFEFQVLSVSSEKWVKMVEVKPAELGAYLKQKQQAGYTLVAVEQTTSGQRLNNFDFPRKTLLLLGNEKEGIPVDLLQYVDECVEIPQLGHTRSLNVHVAASLLIWEYTKQCRFK